MEIAAAVSLLAAYIFWAMYPTITKTYEDQADVIIELVTLSSLYFECSQKQVWKSWLFLNMQPTN